MGSSHGGSSGSRLAKYVRSIFGLEVAGHLDRWKFNSVASIHVQRAVATVGLLQRLDLRYDYIYHETFRSPPNPRVAVLF